MLIGKRSIGPGNPAYLVAELSGNHNQSLDLAKRTIKAAAESGADAIKLQTYTPDTITIDSDRPEFIVGGEAPWRGRTLYDLYREAHTPWEWHAELFNDARAAGLDVFSTPFDLTAVAFLESLNVPVHKIASFEIVDDELLQAVGATRKPVIVSTGMASLEDVAHALDVLRASGCPDVVLLHCTSSYPAPDAAMNLATIPALAAITGTPVGLSDHSTGTAAAIVAVSLGACMIEKHFTLDRSAGGVDSHFSLEPAEFAELVANVRRAEAMMGSVVTLPVPAENANIGLRRSLYAVRDIRANEKYTRENVRSIRPGLGLEPRFLPQILGAHATRPLARGTPLTWDDVLVREPRK